MPVNQILSRFVLVWVFMALNFILPHQNIYQFLDLQVSDLTFVHIFQEARKTTAQRKHRASLSGPPPEPSCTLGSCAASPAVSLTVSLKAQQYRAESDSCAEDFCRWKELLLLWRVAWNPWCSVLLLSVELFRSNRGDSLRQCTYQKRKGFE